jgi:glycine cleavage system H protein
VSEGTSVPSDRRYTSEHEWALVEGDDVVVGITDYAQHELGDVVYVELPAVGGQVTAMKEFGAVESVKSASDLYSPVTGEVVARNEDLGDHPEYVNESPYERGWMIRVRVDDLDAVEGLLDADGYRRLIDA